MSSKDNMERAKSIAASRGWSVMSAVAADRVANNGWMCPCAVGRRCPCGAAEDRIAETGVCKCGLFGPRTESDGAE